MFNMFNLFKPDLSKVNLQDLIGQVTPEQAAQLRTFIVDALLDEKTFNLNNPFFTAIKNDKTGQFNILKDELLNKIALLPDNHPAKKLELN